MKSHTARISSIDGLRGLAILLVLLFHTYARWIDYMPWATVHRELPFFKYGYLGVELFFLISGFVIYMTLEKCGTFFEFMHKRWLRLFPAMLVATILIYCTSGILSERPAGIPKLLDTLPGLLFVGPGLLYKLFGNIDPIEAAFWSLFVEVKFYFVFGAMHFMNRSKAIYALLILFLLRFLYAAMLNFDFIGQIHYVDALISALSLDYFGWFCAGAFLYKSYAERRSVHTAMSVAAVVPSMILIGGGHFEVILACVFIYLIFCAGVFSRRAISVFQSKLFQYFGFVSYPLYLIHENAMVSMSIKVHRYFNDGGMLTPIPGLMIIIAASYLIAKYAEPMLRNALYKFTMKPA